MTKFSGLSGQQVIKALERADFIKISQKGSHVKLRKYQGNKKLTTIVPNHKELKPSVVESILDMAKLTPEEFKELL
jgi:predicted RNA binding protein YcfA (HicA-like mRNA interferase family)